MWSLFQDKVNQLRAIPGSQTRLQTAAELGIKIAEAVLIDVS